ncbi:MAG: hypothetical protein ABSB15_07340 [Bryobacteraceae bacterium]|jgi:hypothetical protein
MPSLDQGIDLIAYDQAGRVVLLAEAKSRVGTSAEWAARFRRNMLSHGTLPDAPFFLIATPERLYFWKQNHADAPDEPPEFTVDATIEFKPYLDKLERTSRTVSEQALEVLVYLWLTDMAQTGDARSKNDPSMRWLADSGLIRSLEKARIEMNPA